MSEYLSAEITATCAALGYYDGTKYHLEKDCLETLKDLIRYLRRDDEDHTIRRYLGRMKLLQTNLIKILVGHADKEDLFEVNLRLLANLTSPPLLLYNEELPTDKAKRNYYLEIVTHLQGYKVVLGDERFWSVLCEKLSQILNIPNDERPEDRGLVIERILILVRNILQVPADVESEKRTDSEGTIHDQVLFALHTSGMADMFLFIASNQDEQQYQMHILEIVSLMLREQSASKLGATEVQRSTAEKERDEAELLAVRQRENLQKIERNRKYAGSRHSRFGGTFVVKNMKAIGENELICHKPFHNLETLEFSQQKEKVKKPKNKLGMRGQNAERKSALSVRLFLKEFCVEFLNGAYNPVMRYARSCITGGNRAQANDESYYLWALKYFMEFNRHYKFQVKFVSETISTEIFHLVQRQLEHYHEMMITDKKKIPLWSRRLHLALKAYQELLHTVMAMDKCADEAVRGSSKVIKSNVFYVPEYRETLLNQLLCYNELTMSRNYLTDLIETVHVFLKMLEVFCGQGRSILVQKLKKKQKRRAKRSKANKEVPPALSLEERWDEASPQLAVVMQSASIPEMIPFDATLDTPIDDQKVDAMKSVQKFLRKNQFEEAIGLLRASREVWPENDSFGHVGMSSEEEFMALREIYFADLGVVLDDETTPGGLDIDSGNEDNPDEEDEEEIQERLTEETDFKFTDFLYRFVNVKVVKACALLLKQFDKNTPEVNHSTVKLLHRIAVQCKTPAMIFQASIFRVFQRILESENPLHKELAKFAIFIVKQFAEVAEKNTKAYMELLFWKTTREATEMVEGYGVEAENKKVSRGVWTETEEDELRTLFMEHQTKNYTQDLVDWLLENIINDNRTRRGVIKKLKEMCLVVNSKSVRNEVQKRLPKEWAEDEVTQLKEIWEVVKDDNDPVDGIHVALRVKRSKAKIKDKLVELGVVQDRKELRKKRSGKKSGSGKSEGGTRSGSDSESGRDSEEDSDNASSRINKRPKKSVVVRKSKKQPTIVYTNAQLSGLLKNVVSQYTEALEWVKESLEDVLEDRDEESTEGVPLVPITDFANAAMDSPNFQRFLRALGIEPPSDEQESFWRVPSNMLSSTIRKRTELIGDGLAGKFVEEDPDAPEPGEQDDSDDEGADIFESVKKFFAPKSISQEDTASGSGSNSIKIARKGTDSESDEQKVEEVDDVGGDLAAVEGGWSKANTSRIKASTLEDSDSEVENEAVTLRKSIGTEEAKRIRSDNSDHESPTVKKRRLMDSDDEEETGVQAPKVPQKMIISDDEDQ